MSSNALDMKLFFSFFDSRVISDTFVNELDSIVQCLEVTKDSMTCGQEQAHCSHQPRCHCEAHL